VILALRILSDGRSGDGAPRRRDHHSQGPSALDCVWVASHVVATSKELSEVLRTVDDSFIFVELLMKPDDAPLGLIRGGHASANFDYGPRGPQSAPGAQIPVPNS
jgi:hypothetical protein